MVDVVVCRLMLQTHGHCGGTSTIFNDPVAQQQPTVDVGDGMICDAMIHDALI